MDRAWLAGRLEAGASYEAIAREVGCSPSKVSYWAERHGLTSSHVPRHNGRGGIDRAVLERLVGDGLTVRAIADATGFATATVRYWLQRHGLRTSAAQEREARLAANAEVTGEVRHCARHGLTYHFPRASGYRCGKCSAAHVTARRRRVKQILVAEAGGCCSVCGYARSLRALEFHHLDPAEKRFPLAYRGLSQSIDKLRAEAAKCVLLCSNCHAEVEDGLVDLPG